MAHGLCVRKKSREELGEPEYTLAVGDENLDAPTH